MGYVYFIQQENKNIFKIGRTDRSPENRLKQIQINYPFKLHIYGCIKTHAPKQLERELHKRFAQYRLQGEWFELPEIEVKALLDNHPDASLPDFLELTQEKGLVCLYQKSTGEIFVSLHSLSKRMSQTYVISLMVSSGFIVFEDGSGWVNYDVLIEDWPDLRKELTEHKELLLKTAKEFQETLS